VGYRAIAAVLGGGTLLALATAAVAMPSMNLRVGDQRQDGGLAWSEWTSGNGHECVTAGADGTGAFPRALEIGEGERDAKWVLHRHQRPAKVELVAWREVDQQGRPAGKGMELPTELHRRTHPDGGRGAWVAPFSVAPPPDYYISAYVRWPGDPECGGPRDALRTYHVSAG
jgi:hypothetical protein